VIRKKTIRKPLDRPRPPKLSMKNLALFVLVAIALLAVLAAAGCATTAPPKENPNATPEQVLAANLFLEAGYESSLVTATANGAPCSVLTLAYTTIVAANRAKIDDLTDVVTEPSLAADYGKAIGYVIGGFEIAGNLAAAKAKADAALAEGLTPEQIAKTLAQAEKEFDKAAAKLDARYAACGGD
jgi:hypothetical protein